jgi:hypothetical protein
VDQGLLGDADHVAGDQHLAALEVDIRPAEAANLAPAGAKHHGQAQEQGQLRALLVRGRQEPGGVLGLRWLHVGLLDRWGGRQLGRVVADPAPHHGLLEGAR